MVTKVNANDDGSMYIGIEYEDVNKELCTLAAFETGIEQLSIPIGAIGFKF